VGKKAASRSKQSQEFRNKVSSSMKEFKAGRLYTSAGHKVTNKKQAIAISLSQAMRYENGPTVRRTWGGVTGERPKLKTEWANVSKKGMSFTSKRRNPHHKSTGSARAAKARGKERKKGK
jgi:hypothetical protein